MPKVRRRSNPGTSLRKYIEGRPKEIDLISLGYTYWDLIGRLFSRESPLDILVKGHYGGNVIQIFQEKNGAKDNTYFFIEAYDNSDELPYFVRIHRDEETKGVVLTYLGIPPWD